MGAVGRRCVYLPVRGFEGRGVGTSMELQRVHDSSLLGEGRPLPVL